MSENREGNLEARKAQARAAIAARGLAASLVKSEAWIKVVLPYLERRRREAVEKTRWAPGMVSSGNSACEIIALTKAWYDGYDSCITQMLRELDTIMNKGNLAAEELQSLEDPKP